MSIINEVNIKNSYHMHQSSLKCDHQLAIFLVTRSPGAAQVPQLFTLIIPSMAEAYLAEVVNSELDIESDRCMVDDIVTGTSPHGNTEPKSAEQRANQGTESCTDNTKSTSKRATEKGKPEYRRLCPGNG
jgi:hypothetical protein